MIISFLNRQRIDYGKTDFSVKGRQSSYLIDFYIFPLTYLHHISIYKFH